MIRHLANGLLFLFTISAVHASELTPPRTSVPIAIDGVLSEPVWQGEPVTRSLITATPERGKPFPYETDVWMAYDDKNLYFSARCYDPEPSLIKTSLKKRDNVHPDDWLAIAFDAVGDRQGVYEFFVNPNGVQEDSFNSRNGGETSAPDYFWESAARVTDSGWEAEVRIPLKSLRFTPGEVTRMGILFSRYIPRLNTQGLWPEMKPEDTIFTFLRDVRLENLAPVQQIEILPSLTYSSTTPRAATRPGWETAERDEAAGVGIKYTRALTTLEMTVNPDFSQVESDAFQVDVNQRFPLFYDEKRPFFQDVGNFYDLASTDANLTTAVYTRSIVSPSWSGKLNGTHGKNTWGILAAEDSWHDPTGPSEDRNTHLFARTKHALGSAGYIGALYTGHSTDSRDNHTLSTDGFFQKGSHRLDFYLTETYLSDEGNSDAGGAGKIGYAYSSRRLEVSSYMEGTTGDFVMDSAYYTRVGFFAGRMQVTPKFYPKPRWAPWLLSVSPKFFVKRLHDSESSLDNDNYQLSVSVETTRDGDATITGWRKTEDWRGKLYYRTGMSFSGGFTPKKWLTLGVYADAGDMIYYDVTNPYNGMARNYTADISLTPGDHLQQTLRYSRSEMDRPSGEREYTVNIVNTSTTYQFNRYLSARGAFRYNNRTTDIARDKLLYDLLFSFTPNPGTVVYLGYGGLLENMDFDGTSWVRGGDQFRETKKALFMKASYNWRG